MPSARLLTLLVLAFTVTAMTGCGSSGGGSAESNEAKDSEGTSRFSCAVFGGYHCLDAATDRGVAVSCARPGSSVAFVAKRG